MFLSNKEGPHAERRMWKVSTSRKLWCMLHQLLTQIQVDPVEQLPTTGPLFDFPAYSENEVSKLLAECVMKEANHDPAGGIPGIQVPLVWKSYAARQSEGPLRPFGVNIDVNRPEGAAPPPAAGTAGETEAAETSILETNEIPRLQYITDGFSSRLLKSGHYFFMNLLICRVCIVRLVYHLLLNEEAPSISQANEAIASGKEERSGFFIIWGEG
jgi:hypothetical protein